MQFKPLYLSLLLLILACSSLAQSPEKVSAMELSLDTLQGVELVKMQCRLAFVFAFRDMPKAYQYGNAAIELADASNDYLAKSNAYRNMGIVYDVDAKGDSALLYFQKSLEYAEVLGSVQEIGFSTNNLGMYHWNKGNLTKAIEFFIQANILAEKDNDTVAMGGAQNNICLIYNELNLPHKAIPYCLKALQLRQENRDTTEILQSQNNLGIAFLDLKKFEAAKTNFAEGLAMSFYSGYEQFQDEFYAGLAVVNMEEGNLFQAQTQILAAIKLLEKSNNLYTLHKQYGTAAEIENRLKNYSRALQYARKGIAITDSLGISSFREPLYQSLAISYFGLGKQTEGLAALDLWNAAKDSTFSINNAQAIAQKEVEYQTIKKEQQIIVQQAELREKAAQNKLLIIGSIAGFLLFSLGILFWQYRSRLQKQKELQALEIKARNDQFLAVLSAEEKERQRLARDLHDGLGQVLSTARMNVSALEESPLQTGDEAILANSLNLIDRAVDEMRNVSHDLMPRVLIQAGLSRALEEMKDKINLGSRVKVNYENEGTDFSFSKEKEIILYRILQELLNNMIKHAGANEINIKLAADNQQYQIALNQDKGQVQLSTLENGQGIGWSNINSRLALLNGTIAVSKFGAAGMQFNISIPKN